jgi:hypothetical protein
MSNRPSVPAHVKRQLRQEAGFGCCVCGLPIYQYHHIVPWHGEQHFRVDDMMLLCPLHHDQATKDALQPDEQLRHKASPFNIERSFAEGTLVVNQNYCAVAIGGLLMVGDGPFIAVNGETILKLQAGQDGALTISVTLYNNFDELVAVVIDNEWITGDPLPWDMESDHQVLRLRSALYKIVLEIDARHEPTRLKGSLWKAGHNFQLKPSGLQVQGPVLNNVSLRNIGLVEVGVSADTQAGSLQPLGPTGVAMLVSEPDPVKRLAHSLQALSKLRFGTDVGADG